MEPPISPLAKRLAEENNVSWHSLRGSGPAGRVVERDVLDHLAQAMSGAADPAPEGPPEGADVWQESADYGAGHRGAAANDFGEALLELDVQAAERPAEPAEDALTGFAFDESVFAEPDDIFVTDGDENAFEAAHQDDGEDALLADVLFEGETALGDDAGGFFASEGKPAGTPESLGVQATETGAPGPDDVGEFEAFGDETFAAETFDAGEVGDPEANGDAEVFVTEAFVTEASDAEATPKADVFRADVPSTEAATDLFFDAPATPAAGSSEEAGGNFAGGAEQSSAEQSSAEQSSGDGGFGGGSESEFENALDSGLRRERSGMSNAGDAARSSHYSSSNDDEDAFRFEGFGDAPEPERTFAGDAAHLEQADQDVLEVTPAETGFSKDVFADEASADSRALEQSAPSPALDSPLNSPPEGTPLAPYVLLRRHLDLAPLEEARRALAQELEGEEGVLTALLLRAVCKALRAVPLTGPAVALALTSGGAFRTAPPSDADAPFAALLEATRSASGPTGSEGEADVVSDLVVADMSRYNLDEVVLNVGAPVLALSRVGGAAEARGALSLSGDVPLGEGAEFLGRVAELLTSPVRLLV